MSLPAALAVDFLVRCYIAVHETAAFLYDLRLIFTTPSIGLYDMPRKEKDS